MGSFVPDGRTEITSRPWLRHVNRSVTGADCKISLQSGLEICGPSLSTALSLASPHVKVLQQSAADHDFMGGQRCLDEENVKFL